MSKQKSISNREAFASHHIKEYAQLKNLQKKAGENDVSITLGKKVIIIAQAMMPDTSVTTEHKVEYTTTAHSILVDLTDKIIGEYHGAYKAQYEKLISEMAQDEQFRPLDGVLRLNCGDLRVALNALNAHGKALLRKYFPRAKGEPTSGLNDAGNAVFYDYLPHDYNRCVKDLFELLALAECKEVKIPNVNIPDEDREFQPEEDGEAPVIQQPVNPSKGGEETPETPQSGNQPEEGDEEDDKLPKIQEPIELPEELKELVGKYNLSVDDQYIAAMTKLWDDLTEEERLSALGKILDELERRSDEISVNMIGHLFIESYLNMPDPNADIED